jgi:hypothetical protein
MFMRAISRLRPVLSVRRRQVNSESKNKTRAVKVRSLFFLFLLSLFFSSCERKLGWGVLLWVDESRGIPSGTVLPVYIKSNIEKMWVVGIPKEYQRAGTKETKIEIPLAQLELAGSERAAHKRSAEFGDYALVYAETLQDGLPVREEPDNSASRVYRLRLGEIIKIISISTGAPAISATGVPLPGDWYRILTQDGTRGYCFSYRLRLFEHLMGPLVAEALPVAGERDEALERLQSKIWSAEIYNNMLNERKFNIDFLSKHWGFSTGEDTGIANVYTRDVDKSFHYSTIRKTGDSAWRFEGTSLSMRLLSDNLLAVDFIDDDGTKRLQHFAALPTLIDDLIEQEKNRREAEYKKLYNAGPIFTSDAFGLLTFTEEGDFLWEDFEGLVPDYIPVSALGRGTIEVRYSIDENLPGNYTGALIFRFKTIGGPDRSINFLYTLGADDMEGALRLEYVRPSYIQDDTVVRTENEPLVFYFYKQE